MDGNRVAVNDKQAASLIGCSTGLLRKWRAQGKGPRVIRIGRLVRYRISDLEAFLDAHVQAPRRTTPAGGCLQ